MTRDEITTASLRLSVPAAFNPRKASDMKRTLLSCAIIGAIAAAESITFSNGRHRVTDPYQPDRRHRRRMKSPAERLVAAANKKRREGN